MAINSPPRSADTISACAIRMLSIVGERDRDGFVVKHRIDEIPDLVVVSLLGAQPAELLSPTQTPSLSSAIIASRRTGTSERTRPR